MITETEPFLSATSIETNYEKLSKNTTTESEDKLPHYRHLIVTIFFHLTLVLCYTIVGTIVIKANNQEIQRAPNAIDGLSVIRDLHPANLKGDGTRGHYSGPPSEKIDQAWDALFEPRDIRISSTELERNERTSIELPDGGGHLAWLGVFHELHCVWLLRQWKYKEHYFANISDANRQTLERHTDHCLDRIRATIMCQPDVSSVVTFYWAQDTKPVVNSSKTLHECVNWDMMIESTRDRVVSRKEMAALKNPLLQ